MSGIIATAASDNPPKVCRFAAVGVCPTRYPARFQVYRRLVHLG
ncbi:hypothetical protein ACFYPX_13085 [Micromonospora zamorensis]